MAVRVQVEAGTDGLIVRKRADGDAAVGLQAEGERLRDAAHPGVVELVSSGPVGDGWELQMRHGGPSLGAGVLALDDVLRVGGAVARTLADLHESGIVHGRLRSERILWGQGTPLLCGFGPGVERPASEDDVAALGVVLRELARASGGDAFVALADAACDAVPARRPSAARLALELEALRVPPTTHDAARRRAIAAGAGGVIVLLIGLLAGVGGGGAGEAAPERTTTSASAVERPTCVAVEGEPARRPECSTTAEVRGGVVVIDGARVTVGRAGDEVAVGDWDCDGTPTAVVLRPTTGELLELGPVEDGGAVEVVRAERIAGAVRIAPQDDDGCPDLAVLTDDGRLVRP